jgi:excisionase family DNA binding protein
MPPKGDDLLVPPPPNTEPSGTAVPLELEGDLTLVTVEEAARRLSVGRTTLYALLKEGEIPSVRIGRLRRIPVEALTDYAVRLIAKQNAS